MGSTTSPGASHDTLSYSTTPNAQQSSCLVYFITGNPGLIGYYEPFLSTLASLLSDSAVGYEISGTSLAGFEALSSDQDSTSSELGPPPYSLRQQIEITERRIAALARRHAQSVSGGGLPPVILIGHSVGAYILLQVLRRHCQREPRHLRIIGGILLFPTVTHIAKSPSGVRLTPFLRLPSLAPSISIIVRGLLFLLPDAALRGLVRLVTGFPEHAISSTVVFLRSKTGVLQSLHMGRDEMLSITEDRWDEEVWGAAMKGDADQGSRAKLVFYFGKKDHWVADHTRDDLIAARGRPIEQDQSTKDSRPKMLIDRDGVPHGFCINHSEMLANKVQGWITEIYDRDGAGKE